MQLLEDPNAPELAAFGFEKCERVTPGMGWRLLASSTKH